MRALPRTAIAGARIAVLGGLLAMAHPASAAPSEAQVRFEEGRALVKGGHPAEAIPKFIASIATEPTVAALLNLADCYERIGKLASAHARFRQAQELAKDKDPMRSEEARKRAEILEPRLSTITLLPPPQTEGVRVWVDGVEITAAEWGKPKPYDAGSHEVIAQDTHGTRRTATVVLGAEAARVTTPIELPTIAATVGPPPPGASGSSTARTAGLVVGGVGVAALITGTVTGILALGATSDLKDSCANYPQCPADRRGELTDLDARARRFGTISTITIIAGAVLLATGAVMVLTAPAAQTQGRAPAKSGSWAGAWQLGAW